MLKAYFASHQAVLNDDIWMEIQPEFTDTYRNGSFGSVGFIPSDPKGYILDHIWYDLMDQEHGSVEAPEKVYLIYFTTPDNSKVPLGSSRECYITRSLEIKDCFICHDGLRDYCDTNGFLVPPNCRFHSKQCDDVWGRSRDQDPPYVTGQWRDDMVPPHGIRVLDPTKLEIQDSCLQFESESEFSDWIKALN